MLLTHAHYDHIGALDDIVTKYDVPVYMHEDEFDFLQDPRKTVLLNSNNMVCHK